MPKRWTKKEEKQKREELVDLYINKNKPIREVADILNLSESGVYDRLIRLNIPSQRSKKPHVNNKRTDINIPNYSTDLAEFIGVMLGDGNLNPNQVKVILNINEKGYAEYVIRLIENIFNAKPKYFTRNNKKALVIYLGSVDIVNWLKDMGLSSNKVRDQVDVPTWIFKRKDYLKSFIRGFFDTDGSVYKIKFGVQISFKNRSLDLLKSIRKILLSLDYNPSKISSSSLYLTRKNDLSRFFRDISPRNTKHKQRYKKFAK